MIFQNYIGLDIRNDKIAAVALKTALRATEVVSQTALDIDPGLTITQKVDLAGEIVGDCIKENKLGKPEIFLAIPKDRVIIREICLPLSVKENLRTTLGYEMQKYVPLPTNAIYYDYLIVDEDRPNNQIEVLLFIIKKEDLDTYSMLSNRIGYPLSGIQIPATAMANFLCTHSVHDATERIGLVRRHLNHAEINLYRGGLFLKTQHVEAGHGSEDFTKRLATVMQTVDDRAGASVQTTAWFVVSEAKNIPSGSGLPEISGVDVKHLDLRATRLTDPSMLNAYSLALQGARKVEPQLNLLPVNQRRKPSRAGIYTMIALIILFFLTGIGWSAGFLVRQRMMTADVDKELVQLQSQIGTVDELASKADTMAQQLADIDRLSAGKISALQVLDELSRRIPTDTWINDLRMNTDGVQLNGYSDSASELLTILEASPLFKNAVFISTITKDKSGKDRFRIGLTFQ